MKANQKFLNGKNSDEGVSPVIAVILMVAITVVLAATVYVWVSGFGASGNQAKSLSLTQGTATYPASSPGASSVPFTIVSVSSNFLCTNLKATSSPAGPWLPGTAAGASAYSMTFNGVACSSYNTATNGALAAGDVIALVGGSNTTSPAAGNTVNLVDGSSNTVVATLTLH
ncbi:MAG: archaellin/type IV pilin N-terminal domain-containing protein [Thermoplasmatota archaeon]